MILVYLFMVTLTMTSTKCVILASVTGILVYGNTNND